MREWMLQGCDGFMCVVVIESPLQLDFQLNRSNFLQIWYQAVVMVESLDKELTLKAGKLFHFLFNFSFSLFTDAAWIEQNQCCGMGFVLVNRDKIILLVGPRNRRAISDIHGELNVLIVALKCCLERSFQPQNIYADCVVLVD